MSENKAIAALALGIDIGSTTVKTALTENGEIIYTRYERHFSKVREKTLELVRDIKDKLDGREFRVAVTGSAGLGTAKAAGLEFVQEVWAESETVRRFEPGTQAVIELGGEDAKIIFFDHGLDMRMNGSCAGGTGAFIDQMATLLDITPEQLDALSLSAKRVYPIASRCGVFAKTDIQPLLNQGAAKEDIAASIYQAVINQTIAGLAQGRAIDKKVVFLGGPLHFCKGLQIRFKETLGLADDMAVFPDYAPVSVAIGAAMHAQKLGTTVTYEELEQRLIQAANAKPTVSFLQPLFENEEEYDAFSRRHCAANVETADAASYSGKAYLGIDCGSTTTKLVLLTEDHKMLYSYYDSNRGDPVGIVRNQLKEIYSLISDGTVIAGVAVTGYGEELIKNAFHADVGLVETMAHYTAAKYFSPDVEFILDVGGQDIKCFKIHDGTIDSIMLNEACSSGCGSFIETFAKSMGYTAQDFSKEGLFAKAPVDLGSRCTVFMNSSVKQAQKDGATVGDISAGLSVSVVKNALYKVIRATSPDELGAHIVVQGGTFLNDAVLRSFEREIGRRVIRPQIAGLMGAFGAALHAQAQGLTESSLIGRDEIEGFSHVSKSLLCKGCGNHCHLTVNTFSDGGKFISGNQCEKGAGIKTLSQSLPNIYESKRNRIQALIDSATEGSTGTIGLPLALGMYELLPLWHTIFASLGFKVEVSGLSSREIYNKGQYSIPSDTACYPAKIMHGHIETLIERGVDAVFYPALTYNMDEKISDNHYNCPVVAYYSEVLGNNMTSLKKTEFLYPYLNINSQKELAKELYGCLKNKFKITKCAVKRAVAKGFEAYDEWMAQTKREGEAAIDFARKNGCRVMILAGRPYHIDPEIGHGIDKLAMLLGFVVVSEDSVYHLADSVPEVQVLNQWTYHSRLYAASQYATRQDDVSLVQLVSFGCGLDAVTTDEVRRLLEKEDAIYTQIKIDEITNLGAVKIRLRSLIGALDERRSKNG